MLPPICHSRDPHPAISLVDATELRFLPNEFKPESSAEQDGSLGQRVVALRPGK